jgi:ubiquinone/menaquinone biosynthesis C-methylase UbiE
MEFGATGLFSVIDAFDFTPKCIAEAKIEAKKRGLPMMNFFVGDTYKFDFSTKQYDIILFEHSLHHFKNVDSIVKKVKTAMHSNSLLVANEYVGVDRFQFPKQRLVDSDLVLKKIPKKFRQRRLPGYYKNKIYAPGLWRVIQSDPSEAVESSTVLPALHAHFKVVEERGWGGNLLHFLLKDITHNFNGIDPETNEIMEFLFSEEDRLIEKEGQHDFLFGVYAKE